MDALDTVFYETPISIRIGLKPEQVKISPLGNDAVILMEINGAHYEALVPTWTLGEDQRSVPAARMGRIGDKELVFFPVSNEGRPTWEITEEDLKTVLVSPSTV